MSGELFAQFQRFVEFTGKDKLALLEARQRLRPFFESVVDEFYGTLLHDPEAQAILDAEIGRLERLRQNLRQWVDQLFCGEYDQAYFEQRSRIGRTHVRIELPQHLMFFGMSVIRRELVRVIIEARLPNAAVVISAVHKLLDLELAVMNDSYREDFVDRTQAVERLQFEQRLGESEHLATIGQVAASLAHEIKNPLAGISGAIQVLGSELGDEHPHKPIIEEALRQIDRLDAAVKDLLLYARPQNPTVARCDLSEIVAESMILLRQEPAFQNVRIRCEGLTERHWAIVDPSQVKQIITNILINAAHACEDDGDIDCALETDARVVRLRITDTGAGIRPEVLSRVFEPFFTTKARGTGLGLAICKRIIEAHQGVILIESRPSVGTRVTVEFPVVP
jgi:signal transduction histidine kinase